MNQATFDILSGIVKAFGTAFHCHATEESGGNWWEMPLPFFGTLRYSDYTAYSTRPRPTSGDPFAIDESLWFFGGDQPFAGKWREARDRVKVLGPGVYRGWGVVRPWARRYNIEIDLPGQGWVTSETGRVRLHPPAKLNGGRRTVLIKNAEPETPATVRFECRYRRELNRYELQSLKPAPEHLRWRGVAPDYVVRTGDPIPDRHRPDPFIVYGCSLNCAIEPGRTVTALELVSELTQSATIEEIEFETIPEEGPAEFRRLYGHPEFL